MKKNYLVSLFILILSSFTLTVSAQNKSAKKPSKEAEEWFHKKEWLDGVNLKPDKSIDVQEFYNQYQANKAYWDKAFEFIKNHDLKTIEPGKYPIDGDLVFAIITYGPTKELDSTKWESHRKYIDLHYVISGEEKIGVSDISKATVTNPYDESKDAANYTTEGKFYTAKPGTFYLFFNDDVHRAGITTGGNKPDKKLVIKIRSAE